MPLGQEKIGLLLELWIHELKLILEKNLHQLTRQLQAFIAIVVSSGKQFVSTFLGHHNELQWQIIQYHTISYKIIQNHTNIWLWYDCDIAQDATLWNIKRCQAAIINQLWVIHCIDHTSDHQAEVAYMGVTCQLRTSLGRLQAMARITTSLKTSMAA